ncbi:uncharacterized protein LOC123529616 [Mercenaria mercenaria]|uniref:uncharacterized protein LOC123529616 n=1 Tax=Mercenaria mercenaria TaxID=6596 RepID=UPI00234F114B|nr:uncharacterized protein LOC123529616 [Mercenaria mercenaria]XP_045165947.2 uncharacterized protein LOC123529616 [Mercenaria mercenaria]
MGATGGIALDKAMTALRNIQNKFEMENGRLAIITPDRYKETYDIMANDFTPDEPLCRSFGVSWNEDFKQTTYDNLVQNASICMISKDTQEIMGIRIIGIMRKTDPPADFKGLGYEPLRGLFTFLTHKDNEVNFFERYEVDEAIHFFALGVNKKYRRMGLGGRLLAAAVAMSKELEFKAIKGEGTSNFSQRIYEKEKFETLLTLPYDSYIYKGQPIINGTGEHKMTKIYGLKL